MLAACALWIHGDPPLLMHMGCDASDYPHVVALFRRRSGWGAISKSNGPYLRFRDPVYRSLRELAMSYFHEYTSKRGHKTLRSRSAPYDLRRLDPACWVTSRDHCWSAHDHLASSRHYPLLATGGERSLAPLDGFVRRASRLEEYPRRV